MLQSRLLADISCFFFLLWQKKSQICTKHAFRAMMQRKYMTSPINQHALFKSLRKREIQKSIGKRDLLQSYIHVGFKSFYKALYLPWSHASSTVLNEHYHNSSTAAVTLLVLVVVTPTNRQKPFFAKPYNHQTTSQDSLEHQHPIISYLKLLVKRKNLLSSFQNDLLDSFPWMPIKYGFMRALILEEKDLSYCFVLFYVRFLLSVPFFPTSYITFC